MQRGNDAYTHHAARVASKNPFPTGRFAVMLRRSDL